MEAMLVALHGGKEPLTAKEKIGVVLDDSFLSEYLTPRQINSIMKDIYLSLIHIYFTNSSIF